ncbi:MAG: energy transducer TonB [Metallibacterium sp.]
MLKRTVLLLFTMSLVFCLIVSACTILPQQPQDAGETLPEGWIHFALDNPQYNIPPIFLSGKAPIYPIREALDGKAGVTLVRYTIGVDGHVHDAKVLSASNQYFGTAMLYAMKSWLFEPAKINNINVPVTIIQPMRFSSGQ